jgi:predicted transposase YbfD/YdcC
MRPLFPPYQRRLWQEDLQSATSTNKGHGRVEKRTVTTSTWLNQYHRAWPKLSQVVRVERERRICGETTVEVAYYITSLGRDRADATRLGELIRDHWGIENRLHHVRDVTLGEDASRVRRGSSVQVLAALRNTVVYLLSLVKAPSKAAAIRRFAAHPNEAVRLVLT